MGAIDRIFRGRRGGQDRPLAAQVAALFANGEQGLWYDVQGFRSSWGSAGPELLPEGSFDSAAGWNVIEPGWVVGSGKASVNNTSGITARLQRVFTPPTARWYLITIDISSLSSGTISITHGGSSSASYTKPGKYTFLNYRSDVYSLYIAAAAGTVAEVESISAVEWLGLPSCPMFQDAIGSLPVYLPGQGQTDPPVGLVLDRRDGLARSAEVWDDSRFVPTGESSRISAGVYRIYSSAGAYSGVGISGYALTAGRWYEVTFNVDSIATIGGGIQVEGAVTYSIQTTGFKRQIVMASGTQVIIKRASGAVDYQISNVSFKPLNGNHAYQATTASRPTLSARYNLLTNTNFSGAVSGSPGTAPTGWSLAFNAGSIDSVVPIASDYAIAFSAVLGREVITQSFTAAANTTYSCSFDILANSGMSLLYITGFTGAPAGSSLAYFADGAAVTSGYVPTAGQRVEVRLAISTTAGTPAWRLGAGAPGNVTGSVTVARPDIRVTGDGVGIPLYQRVVDANTYDTAGFPLFLKLDGIDDWLLTAAIDFSGSDKLVVAATLRKLTDAARGTVLELTSSYANAGAFAVEAPWVVLNNVAAVYSGATTTQGTSAAMSAPASFIFSATFDLGQPRIAARLNGVQGAAVSGATGGGNFTSGALYIGRRAGNSQPFNGRIFGLLVRSGASNDAQIAKVERLLNQKAKVA